MLLVLFTVNVRVAPLVEVVKVKFPFAEVPKAGSAPVEPTKRVPVSRTKIRNGNT